jgi:hypothetical protein
MKRRLTLEILTNDDQLHSVREYAEIVGKELPHEEGALWLDLFRRSIVITDPKQILISIRYAQRYVWERLHEGIWHQVLPHWRYAYHCTNIISAAAIFCSCQDALKKSRQALFEIDLALIMSGPFEQFNVDSIVSELVKDIQIRQQQSILPSIHKKHEKHEKHEKYEQRPTKRQRTTKNENDDCTMPSQFSTLPALKIELDRGDLAVSNVKRLNRPSMSVFKRQVFDTRCPHIIEDVVNHWPAYKRWNIDYLLKVAGPRTVPVEIGRNYMSKEWTQQLMTFDAFVNTYVRCGSSSSSSSSSNNNNNNNNNNNTTTTTTSSSNANSASNTSQQIAYLAQHELFDQITELSRDIVEPDYCIFTNNDSASKMSTTIQDDAQLLPNVQRNSWFGPRSTVSPLHYDKYHNLFCQIFGSKTILLIHPKYSPSLYPNDGVQCNTSQVDLQCEGWVERWPNIKNIPCKIVTVRSGEMLYIPPKWWHFCVAEETSFSVSYWWSAVA